MRPVKVAFANLRLRHLSQDSTFPEFADSALSSAQFEGVDDPTSSMSGFVNVERRELLGMDCVVGRFAYASGKRHESIDPESHGLQAVPYEEPPLKGKSLFVLHPEGRAILENKATPALRAEKVLSRMKDEFRRHGHFEVIPEGDRLGFSSSNESLIDFIEGLDRLTQVELANLRHSNPQERSEYLDRAADQRIEEIRYRAHGPEGIDRSHDEFENQMSHVENGYGDIRSARGTDDGLRRGMTRGEDEAEFEVELDYEEEEDRPLALLRVLLTVWERLQIVDRW